MSLLVWRRTRVNAARKNENGTKGLWLSTDERGWQGALYVGANASGVGC